jgi:hypothetical protein
VSRSDLAPGLLLLMLGLFVILRSVNHDQTQRTLVDRILGKHVTPTVPAGTTGGSYHPVPKSTRKFSLAQSKKIPAGKK